MSNGYVGVDIFFVLSGYLISSILLRQIISTGKLDFPVFYARRFRRLFPASSVVLILTAFYYRLLELPEYVLKHRQTFIASSSYYQNWYGLQQELDYFNDRGAAQSPAVHFWSLSTEEQYYAFFPAFIYITSALMKKKLNHILIFFNLTFFVSLLVNINYIIITQWFLISRRLVEFIN